MLDKITYFDIKAWYFKILTQNNLVLHIINRQMVTQITQNP